MQAIVLIVVAPTALRGVGISMMRVKLKAVESALHERELQKAG